MDPTALSSYFFNGLGTSLVEILDKTDFDELFEIDTVKMRAFNIYHVEGKYLAPFMEGSHLDIYRYAADNMVHPDDREMHSRFMEPYTIYDRVVNDPDTPGLIHAEFRYRLLDGGWRWVEQLMVAGKEQGLPDGIIRVYVYDIQSRKDRELGNTVRFTEDSDSKRDEKTGLLPEKAFFIKAGRLLEDADRSWCLVTIDLEHFRLFNDWYGRDTGDVLIAQIGAELRRVEKSTGGAAGYFGQDDFCLVVPYDDAKIRRLHANLCKIVESHGSSFGFTPIFGVCMSDPTTSAAELYDRASIAQTFAKTKIQERISLFNNSMFDQTDKEYRILSDFREGLKNREFFFVLQPQCRASTGKIVGAESLARWRKSDGTIVSPGVFVPVLEKYGFITVLDKFIWEEVCIWLRRWIDEGHKPLPISVNVSQIDIFGMDVAKFFEELVKKYDLSNDLIKIEITESAYVENGDVVRKTVQELRKKGFVVLMDDFGSGYSSLNMLRNLNVDVIKLDAQFLTTSQGDSVKGLHIIESIVNMVKTLELPIIVEGVEYREQREFLEDLGCRYVQGYFFYKPMAVELFEALISDQDNVDDRGFILKHNEQFRLREFLDENIYSDNMLNNILGPVCIYSRDDGRHVNITRFNEQFYKMVDEPEFARRLDDITRFMPEQEAQRLQNAMDLAVRDKMNGNTSEMTFIKQDGTPVRVMTHFYYLGDYSDGQHFYGAVQDITALTKLQFQLDLLTRFSSGSLVFVTRKADGGVFFTVTVYGLGSFVGLDKDAFERELNMRCFAALFGEEAAEKLDGICALPGKKPKTSMKVEVRDGSGQPHLLSIKTEDVPENDLGVECILVFKKEYDLDK